MKLRCMLCGKLIEEELVCNEPVDEFDDEYDDDLPKRNPCRFVSCVRPSSNARRTVRKNTQAYVIF